MATAYGCAGTSSGSTSMGVWQARTKSRVTVKTKSALERYILLRNESTIAIVISGRRAHSGGPQPVMLLLEKRSGISGRNPLGCAITAATMRFGARRNKFQM